MGNVLLMGKKHVIEGMIRLGWPNRRFQRETGLHRITVAKYRKALQNRPRVSASQGPVANEASVPAIVWHLEDAAGIALARHNLSYHFVKSLSESLRGNEGNTQETLTEEHELIRSLSEYQTHVNERMNGIMEKLQTALRTLRLSSLASALPSRYVLAKAQEMDYLAFLETLVEDEMAKRKDSLLSRRSDCHQPARRGLGEDPGRYGGHLRHPGPFLDKIRILPFKGKSYRLNRPKKRIFHHAGVAYFEVPADKGNNQAEEYRIGHSLQK